jgi:hypothetical protein
MRTRFQFALRTPDRLAVFGRFHGPELYDLSRDPGALHNLCPDAEECYPYLGRLRSIVNARWDGGPSEDSVELSPEDRATLRALGYVD